MSTTPVRSRPGRGGPLAFAGALLGGFLAGAGALGPARAPSAPGHDPAPFIVGNDPVGWDEIRPRLAEIAGAQVVEELTLENRLRNEFTSRAITLTPEDIDRERSLFSMTLRRAMPIGDEPAVEQALARVRRTRALGPDRFDALLRRSAMLRKLVAPEVRVDEDEVRASLEVRFGPRVRCRIIVMGVETEARRLHERLRAGPPEDLAQRFAAEARILSVDPSGARGGEVEPISPVDPTYAASFREALRDLQPGALSPVLVFDRGYAIALGVDRLPGATPPPGAEEAARDDVRQRLERAAMDVLAARLLNSAPVTVFDPSLNWSWTGRAAR